MCVCVSGKSQRQIILWVQLRFFNGNRNGCPKFQLLDLASEMTTLWKDEEPFAPSLLHLWKERFDGCCFQAGFDRNWAMKVSTQSINGRYLWQMVSFRLLWRSSDVYGHLADTKQSSKLMRPDSWRLYLLPLPACLMQRNSCGPADDAAMEYFAFRCLVHPMKKTGHLWGYNGHAISQRVNCFHFPQHQSHLYRVMHFYGREFLSPALGIVVSCHRGTLRDANDSESGHKIRRLGLRSTSFCGQGLLENFVA